MERSRVHSVLSPSLLASSVASGLALFLMVPANVSAQAQPAETSAAESQADKEIKQLDAIRVTGSRLSKADAEDALPVTVLTKEDIRATGLSTVAEVLRTLPYNSQGSATPSPGSTGQGVTTVNLRGLGDGRTLILINGRRIPADATYFGFAVSTSFIPIGAVERIEVLRDGASAIYGSDALAGVVNIVLREDFEGTEVTLAFDTPTGGGGDTLVANVTTGAAGTRGGYIISAEKRWMDPVQNVKRSPLSSDYSTLGFGFLSNSFPGTYQATDFFGDGSNVSGPYTAAPGCESTNLLNGGPITVTHPTSGQQAIAQQEQCRNPVSNKKDHFPKFDVESAYLSGHWYATEDLKLFAEALLVNQNSQGRRESVTGSLNMAADNPNNPTKAATLTNPVAGVSKPSDISVLYALPDAYGRTLDMASQQRNVVGGFEWLTGSGTLSGHYQYARQSADSYYRNALYVQPFKAAVGSGELNLFDKAAVSAYQSFLRTGQRTTVSILKSSSLNWTSELPVLELPGGPIRYGIGYEGRSESIQESCDPLSGAFALSGAFCLSFGSKRSVHAGYVEASLPVLKNLEVNYAGRWDSYDVPDFSKLSNRLAVRYQPIKSLTLRASYSEGIRAPNLYEINSSSGLTTSSVVDTTACARVAGNPSDPACFPIQVTQILKGGPNLLPERSKSVSWGAIWAPSLKFSLAADYFKVRIEDQIQNLGDQMVVDLEAQGLNLSRYSVSVERDANGKLVSLTSGSANVPGFTTSGIDTEATLNLSFGGGKGLQSRLLLSWIIDYERPSAPGAEIFDAIGYVGQPQLLGNWNTTYNWSDWSINARWNYIGEYDARSPEERYVLDIPYQGRIAPYQTFDLSLSYQAPWDARISLGTRNITNRSPTISRYAFGDVGYNTGMSDINGRVLMLSYAQKF